MLCFWGLSLFFYVHDFSSCESIEKKISFIFPLEFFRGSIWKLEFQRRAMTFMYLTFCLWSNVLSGQLVSWLVFLSCGIHRQITAQAVKYEEK